MKSFDNFACQISDKRSCESSTEAELFKGSVRYGVHETDNCDWRCTWLL